MTDGPHPCKACGRSTRGTEYAEVQPIPWAGHRQGWIALCGICVEDATRQHLHANRTVRP